MFNENLVKILEAKGMTVEDLVNVSNIPLEKIESWVVGATLPSYLAIVILSKALGVMSKELIDVGIDMNNLPKNIEFKVNFYMNYTKKNCM